MNIRVNELFVLSTARAISKIEDLKSSCNSVISQVALGPGHTSHYVGSSDSKQFEHTITDFPAVSNVRKYS